MINTISQIATLLLGLGLVFFGLPLFRGALNVFGFVFGAIYGVFLFTLFSDQMSLEPMLNFFFGALAAIVCGLIGMGLANFAQAIFVFIAGGLVALLIARLIAGIPPGQAAQAFSLDQIAGTLHPKIADFIWFAIGGIIFLLALDTVMIFALVALGATLIYRAIEPMNLFEPSWIIPLVLGVLGLMAQESLRHRMMKSRRIIIIKKEHHQLH